MRREFPVILRCPSCRAVGAFGTSVEMEAHGEIRVGRITCAECGEARSVSGGIVDLLPPGLPEFVARESAGLDRFADVMRNDGWDRARILNLPYEQSGYWFVQATSMHQILGTVPLQPGDRILDVGSNTCWASATFAERGLQAVALDINAGEMQGLATCDWWRDAKDVHIERVLGVMFDLPFGDNSFDWVWCCEVLHHNHRENLDRTMRELHRTLRPGGAALIVNETLRSLKEPHLNPGQEVAEFDGHEHAYVRRSYVAAARRAGFNVEVRGSWVHRLFQDNGVTISRRMSALDGFRAASFHAVRRNAIARKVGLWWLAYVRGGSPLVMIARKPSNG